MMVLKELRGENVLREILKRRSELICSLLSSTQSQDDAALHMVARVHCYTVTLFTTSARHSETHRCHD